jgi:putative CocE/NonD family hydrolase
MKTKIKFLSLTLILFFAALNTTYIPAQSKIQQEATPPIYEFTIKSDWLTMKDKVRLSVTFFKPLPRYPGEKFPVLFEFLPYRKDDSFYLRDYPLYSYFVRRGFIMAKVDVRGTGSSEGTVPPREYSEQELADAFEIIDQLSKLPDSNGRVGMWGISWGGFNSIQVAMRQPPALKAILAIDASDDLFHDDVHYIDGAYHVDAYELSIDHENGLPRTPDYKLDEDYFQDRFNAYPWFLTYLKQQKDGDFWRRNSLRWNYDQVRIPAYIIGGLLDGYRDSVPRMLENMKIPIKAEIGPWVHAWPDNGVPGPNYEWRHEAVRWWDYWLKNRDTGILDDPRLTVFIREGHGPDLNLQMTPGQWVCTDWPIPGTSWMKFFPGKDYQLQTQPDKPAMEALRYIPSYGQATGFWWGEPTGDMRSDDAGSLVFNSPVLEEKFEIVGFPKVHLRVSADAPLAHWIVRVEDVQPNGTVSLVTGALLNGSQRLSRLSPESLTPGETYDLEIEMHFTTWTFKPGHRLRLAVSNSLFPMIWPTPYPMTTKLMVGDANTCLELPVIPLQGRKGPNFRAPEPREQRPDARYLGGEGWPHGIYELKKDLWNSTVSVVWQGTNDFEIQGRQYLTYEKNYFETNDENPAQSCFRGEAGHRIKFKDRELYLRTTIDLHSDNKNFKVTIVREIFENDILVRKKEWKETIPRMFN